MKKRRSLQAQLAFAAGLGLLSMMILPSVSNALVNGACDECHTMHDSQDNAQMAVTGGPYDVLLLGDCLSCHTGTNDATNVRPYVFNATAAGYGPLGDTLAGGNFFWVQTIDARGHNVDFVTPGGDATLAVPPGFDEAAAWSVRVAAQTDLTTAELTCAGTAGCHGDRDTAPGNATNYGSIKGAHHADDTTIDGNTVGTSFRFLYGIEGTEQARWEYQAGVGDDHNGYWGTNRAADTVDDANTISSLCGQCHGGFHNSVEPTANAGWVNSGDPGIQGSGAAMTNPWIRHPTDFQMPASATGDDTSDYWYNGGGGYDPMVPLGSTAGNVVTGATNPAGGDRIVICLSCHRAHGSPYADLLRWTYGGMVVGPSGDVGEGCFVCHNAKDN